MPDRFRQWDRSAFDFIPQGDGDHRCEGEWITIELVKKTVDLLTEGMQYNVPEQDLTIEPSRTPAAPKSRFIILPTCGEPASKKATETAVRPRLGARSRNRRIEDPRLGRTFRTPFRAHRG